MTRIELARRRVTIARYTIGVAAAAALAAFAAAARISHPATHHTTRSRSQSVSPQVAPSSDDSFFDGGGSSIGPSGSAAPQIQSGGS